MPDIYQRTREGSATIGEIFDGYFNGERYAGLTIGNIASYIRRWRNSRVRTGCFAGSGRAAGATGSSGAGTAARIFFAGVCQGGYRSDAKRCKTIS
jgi:hypothetical protein